VRQSGRTGKNAGVAAWLWMRIRPRR